jgi:exodeoxyribonuclease VII large subunit
LQAAEQRLPDLPAMVAGCRERVQERGVRLIMALPNFVERRHSALDLCGQKLVAGLRHAVSRIHGRAAPTLARLEAVSPLAVLKRGYAVVSDHSGHPLTTAAAVAPGARLRLRFADGEVGATAERPERQGKLPL